MSFLNSGSDKYLYVLQIPLYQHLLREIRNLISAVKEGDYRTLVTQRKGDLTCRTECTGKRDHNRGTEDIDVIAGHRVSTLLPTQRQMRLNRNLDPRIRGSP